MSFTIHVSEKNLPCDVETKLRVTFEMFFMRQSVAAKLSPQLKNLHSSKMSTIHTVKVLSHEQEPFAELLWDLYAVKQVVDFWEAKGILGFRISSQTAWMRFMTIV